jgi:hypothetical protein
VASRAADLFERSKTEQKRELIAFVFSNLRLRGKKLEFSLRSPFDLMANRADHTSWLAFLNTVRTERFEHVLAFARTVPSFEAVKNKSGCAHPCLLTMGGLTIHPPTSG